MSCLLFSIHDVAGAGLRVVEAVLRNSGLDRFVASSPSTLEIQAAAMEELICEFGEIQQAELGPTMPHRQISALEDETWLNVMHLVAMDAVSGFILLEEPAKRRDGQTWHAAMGKAMAGLNAKIVQLTSDKAKGLVHHAEVLLGVQHSPDLFHIQREISKGLGASLARNVRHAIKALEVAQDKLSLLQAARLEELKDENVSTGRPIGWENHLAVAADVVKAAQQAHTTALDLQKRFRTALGGLSRDYHLVDIEAGTLRSAKDLDALLKRCWDAVMLFQRSSSALEGRNGRLSQIHAMGRGLGRRTLKSLMVIANYHVTRSDGTTADERFFGQKHASLVEWVFERMPLFAVSRKTNRAPLWEVR